MYARIRDYVQNKLVKYRTELDEFLKNYSPEHKKLLADVAESRINMDFSDVIDNTDIIDEENREDRILIFIYMYEPEFVEQYNIIKIFENNSLKQETLSRSKLTSKSPVTMKSNKEVYKDQLEYCINLFDSIRNEKIDKVYKKFANKIMKRCTLAKREEPDKDNRKTRLINILISAIFNGDRFTMTVANDQYSVIKDLYKYVNTSYKNKKSFVKNLESFISFIGEEAVDAGGLSNQFFQHISDFISNLEHEIFVPISGDSDRYIPNNSLSEMKIQEYVDKKISVTEFFEFIGLLCFKLIIRKNPIKIPIAKMCFTKTYL